MFNKQINSHYTRYLILSEANSILNKLKISETNILLSSIIRIVKNSDLYFLFKKIY